MPQRNVATNFTFEQQRVEINNLAQDFWTHKTTVDGASSTYLKHDGSNAFTGQTLAVPNAFTINSDSGNGTVTISGNLNVSGTTTTVNTTNLDVTDKNITIAKGNTADATADGAGITIDSATDITWNFVDANDAWVSSIGVEATTFLKGPYGQFTGSTTATTGSGVEVFAPDANTGQIQAYNRGTSAFNELRLKGSSVGVYTGTTNAIAGTFNSTGLTMESGKTITSSGIIVNGNTGIEIAGDNTVLKFTENDANPDFGFLGNAGSLRIQDLTATANLFIFESDKVRSIKNFDAEGGLDVTGNTTTTGHLSIANDKGIFFDGTTTTNDTIWRNSGENSLSISSRFDVNVFIDSNNDDTAASFTISKDNTTKASATELFRVNSAGQVIIGNNPSVDANTNLHIEEASGECGVVIEGNTAGAGAYLLLRNNSTTSDPRTYIGGLDAGGQGTSQIDFYNLSDTNNEGEIRFSTRPAGGSMTEALKITSEGDVSISGDGTIHGVSKLTILPANRTTAFAPEDGDTWHDVVLKQTGDAQTNAVGIAFEISTSGYHKNAGTGIAAVKNGTAGDYGTDLVFITRGQSTPSTEKLRITSTAGIVLPGTDNTQDLGSTAKRWANVYTGDLNLCNEGSCNEVDGTSGSWTMQEGDSDLFLINRKSGKKYKFNLTEVS